MGLKQLFVGMAAATAALASPSIGHEQTSRTGQTPSLSIAARNAATTVDSFHAALQRGDARAAAALLANDAIIFEEGGVERTKAEYAAHHLPADAEFSKAVQSQVTNRRGHSDGDIAWIASEGRTTGTFRGRTLDRVTTETMVLRRAGKNWKIVHIHWSSAAANQQ